MTIVTQIIHVIQANPTVPPIISKEHGYKSYFRYILMAWEFRFRRCACPENTSKDSFDGIGYLPESRPSETIFEV